MEDSNPAGSREVIRTVCVGWLVNQENYGNAADPSNRSFLFFLKINHQGCLTVRRALETVGTNRPPISSGPLNVVVRKGDKRCRGHPASCAGTCRGAEFLLEKRSCIAKFFGPVIPLKSIKVF
jgi:hypothetical protein